MSVFIQFSHVNDYYNILVAFLNIYKVARHSKLSGSQSPNSEKFYLKSVSPEEIAKIEYEDSIQLYGKMFELKHKLNLYDYNYINK
jgi:hypothetical protein